MSNKASHNPNKPSLARGMMLTAVGTMAIMYVHDNAKSHETHSVKSGVVAEKQADMQVPGDINLREAIVPGVNYNGWVLQADWEKDIDAAKLSPAQKEFAKFSLLASMEQAKEGFPINPRVLAGQADFESGFGAHRAADNNFLGVKGSGPNSHVTKTKEDGPNGLYSTPDSFAGYGGPLDGFRSVAEMEGRLKHFRDASNIDCRKDDKSNLEGLQYRIGADCQIIDQKGSRYATLKKHEYVDRVLNVIDIANLDQAVKYQQP